MMRDLPPALGLLGVGWYVATCITLGVVAGLWLDGQAGSSPALTLLGLALGLASAGWGGYRMLKDVLDAQARRAREGRADPAQRGDGSDRDAE